jgi:hypothetical protein
MATVRQNRKMQAGASSSESIPTNNHLSEEVKLTTPERFSCMHILKGKGTESGYIVDFIKQKKS